MNDAQTLPTLTPLELLHRLRAEDFGPGQSPLGEFPCLLLDLAHEEATSLGIAAQLHPLVGHLPCPLVGVGPIGADGPCGRVCDVLVEGGKNADLAGIAANIAAAPIAAMILVQVLRSIEQMAAADALAVESMAYGVLQGGAEFSSWLDRRGTQETPPPGSGPALRLERSGHRMLLEINRPETRNAISAEIRDQLVSAFQLIVADPTITEVHLQGAGRCFSIGGALDEFGQVPSVAYAHVLRSVQSPGRWLMRCADRVTAHVHGACIGAGIEIPAFAARLVARSNSYFQLPELRMGLIPGAGGCISISRRIGRQRTAWMVLSGRRINAATALRWGLIDNIEN